MPNGFDGGSLGDLIGSAFGLGGSEEKAGLDFGPLTLGIRPKFKEAMDSLEAFFDEYIDLLEKLERSPEDAALLQEYAELLVQYEVSMRKLEMIEDIEMSDAEAAYYAMVVLRIDEKLFKAIEALE